MPDDCLACRELAGEIELPGGFLHDDEYVVAFHVPPLEVNSRPYLGHCLVLTRRHVDHLADLTEEEAGAVAQVSRRLAAALRAEGAERVHVAVIGLGDPHFHQHLLPRYPGVPKGIPWTEIDQAPNAPHGDAPEIAAFAERLRVHL